MVSLLTTLQEHTLLSHTHRKIFLLALVSTTTTLPLATIWTFCHTNASTANHSKSLEAFWSESRASRGHFANSLDKECRCCSIGCVLSELPSKVSGGCFSHKLHLSSIITTVCSSGYCSPPPPGDTGTCWVAPWLQAICDYYFLFFHHPVQDQ